MILLNHITKVGLLHLARYLARQTSESGLSKDRDSQERLEHWGLNILAKPLEGLERKLAKHVNGDRGSLPMFRPPCGVKPYSCLSDGLHCCRYSTRCELVLEFRLGRLEDEIGRPFYEGEVPLL